jgi:hypothetical protein
MGSGHHQGEEFMSKKHRGHIVSRGRPDTWAIVLETVDPSSGKRKQRWVNVHGSEKGARRQLDTLLDQLDGGTYVANSRTTVRQYLLDIHLPYLVGSNLIGPKTAERSQQLAPAASLARLVPCGSLTSP